MSGATDGLPPSKTIRSLSILSALSWLAVSYPVLYVLQFKVQGVALLAFVVTAASLLRFSSVVSRIQTAILAPKLPVFLAVVSGMHALVSAVVTYAVARTQPFSIDGMVYLFQARALGHGVFGAPMEFPRQFFSQRFLFQGADGALHGVFPPGWPLFLAPWVRLGIPMLAGPLVAVLLALSTYWLAKKLAALDDVAADPTRSEWIARVAVLLSLPSFARAVETADILSHAFVATLGALACALALDDSPTRSRRHLLTSVALGLCLGWAFASRLLDGLLLAAIAATAVLIRSRGDLTRVALTGCLVLAAATPGVFLTAASQKQATGSWFRPTQSEYFRRSDFPASCHRLGFGQDVGCYVEHGEERAIMGAAGYTPSRAYQVTRSRASALCEDLASPGLLLLITFALSAFRPRKSTVFATTATVFFTLGYGLFYYGNAPLFGARHLFPCAPFLYYLLASECAQLEKTASPQGRVRFSETSRTALAVALFVALASGHAQRWKGLKHFWSYTTENELGVREAIARAEFPSGIIATPYINHAIGAYDPWTDRGVRTVVADNYAGLLDIRRAHPDWQVLMARLNATLTPTRSFELPPNLSIECESVWPSLQFPQGVQVGRALSLDYSRILRTSGNQVLSLTRGHVGSSVLIHFDSVDEGVFQFELGYLALPTGGDFRLSLDGSYLLTLHAYGPAMAYGVVEAPQLRAVTLGPHSVLIECIGKDPRSRGYDGALDIIQARRPQ